MNKWILIINVIVLSSCGFANKNSPPKNSNSESQTATKALTLTNQQTITATATTTTEETNTEAPLPVKKKTAPLSKVELKKKTFIEQMLPACKKVHNRLTQLYLQSLEQINVNPEHPDLINLRHRYNVNNNDELLLAIKPHPISITLAQAAMESAWGTSRFYKEANNIFGVWSFNSSDQRIAAGQSREGKTIWLKKYDNLEQSISDYYKILAKVSAYKEFRQSKALSEDPFVLLPKLDKYSERGIDYTNEIAKMISFNQFDLYD